MPNIIAEIAIDPIGTDSPHESDYVVAAERVLKNAIHNGTIIHYRINPMSTTVEGDFHEVLELLGKMHKAPFIEGAERVITTIRIDERNDREVSMKRSVELVEKKLNASKADMC